MTIDYQAPDYPLQIEGFTNQADDMAIVWQWTIDDVARVTNKGKDK